MSKKLFRDPEYDAMLTLLNDKEREQLEGAAATIQDRPQVAHEIMLCGMIDESRDELNTALATLSDWLQLLHTIEIRLQLQAVDVA